MLKTGIEKCILPIDWYQNELASLSRKKDFFFENLRVIPIDFFSFCYSYDAM